MTSIAIACILSLVISLVTTPFVRQLAFILGAVDNPERARKVHANITPRLGGLAVFIGAASSILALFVLDTGLAQLLKATILRELVAISIGSLIILLLGIYDDLRGAKASLKFSFQLVAALIVLTNWSGFDYVSLPWGGQFYVGSWSWPIGLLWLIGITNAVNLIDGLDGLASGIVLLALVPVLVIAIHSGNLVMALVGASLAGALVGFIRHNFHPASIFLGDTGSLFIGFVLASLGLVTSAKASTTAALFVPIVALGVPIADTTLAFTRRVIRGRSPFSADREHVHHKLLDSGFGHLGSVLMIWLLGALSAFTSVCLVVVKGGAAMWVLTAFVLVTFAGIKKLGYLDINGFRASWQVGRTNSALRKARQRHLRQLWLQLSEIDTADELRATLDEFHQPEGYLVFEWCKDELCFYSWQSDLADTALKVVAYPISDELGEVRIHLPELSSLDAVGETEIMDLIIHIKTFCRRLDLRNLNQLRRAPESDTRSPFTVH